MITLDDLHKELERLQSRIDRFEKKLSPMKEKAKNIGIAIDVLSEMSSGDRAKSESRNDLIDKRIEVVEGDEAPMRSVTIKESIRKVLSDTGMAMPLSVINSRLRAQGHDFKLKSIRGILSAEKRIFQQAGRGFWKLRSRPILNLSSFHAPILNGNGTHENET